MNLFWNLERPAQSCLRLSLLWYRASYSFFHPFARMSAHVAAAAVLVVEETKWHRVTIRIGISARCSMIGTQPNTLKSNMTYSSSTKNPPAISWFSGWHSTSFNGSTSSEITFLWCGPNTFIISRNWSIISVNLNGEWARSMYSERWWSLLKSETIHSIYGMNSTLFCIHDLDRCAWFCKGHHQCRLRRVVQEWGEIDDAKRSIFLLFKEKFRVQTALKTGGILA